MVDLKTMVKNKCEDDRTLATRLAKLLDYKNTTPLYKFFNELDREIDFQQVLTIVQEIWPDREFELMTSYILTLKPTQRCARESLEYLTLNKLNDVFVEMMDKLQCSSNKESQEWAETYRVHWNVLNGKLERMEAIELINGMNIKSDEMKVFSKIIQFYYYNDLKLIGIMREVTYLIQNGIENLKESFIKNYFECRFITVLMSLQLHTNDVFGLMDKVELLLPKITNHNLLNIMYVLIGNTYLITDYDKALMYFQKAIYHSEKVNNNGRTDQAYKSINLLNSLWNKKKEFILINEDKDSVLSDMAFNKCNFDKREGMALLEQVDTSSFSNYGKAFYYYYLGVASGNEDHFYESLEYFNIAGEKFFKKLPLIELEKIGVKPSIIKALSV